MDESTPSLSSLAISAWEAADRPAAALPLLALLPLPPEPVGDVAATHPA